MRSDEGAVQSDPADAAVSVDADARGEPQEDTPAPRVDAGAAPRDSQSPARPRDAGVTSKPEDAASSPASNDPPCEPSGGGPYALVESESLSIEIRCGTGADVPATFAIEGLPAGAVYDAPAKTLRWTPGLDQAAVYELTLRGTSANDTGTIAISVADRFDAPDNVPIQDAAKYTEEFGLPVIHLTTDPAINDEEYTPATIVYRGHTFTGTEAKLRGTVSALYPKRSYTLKFTKADKFGDAGAAGGFLNKRKIVLITSFDDNSYLRQRLSFELWNRLGPTQIRVQSYSAVLFLNGQYYGLYTLADHVNEYLMEDFGLNQAGNLYKGRNGDANFHTLKSTGAAKTTPHDGFSKEEGLPEDGQPGAFDDLDAFLTWVNTVPQDEFTRDVDRTILRSDYENWWILTTFAIADDSVGKNSYHYHDPTLPSSVWRCLPWDFNHSFGQSWQTRRVDARSAQPESNYYFGANGLFQRLLVDPTLGPPLRARYGEVLATSYAIADLVALLDAMREEIASSAHRDEQKWAVQYRSFMSWMDRTDITTFDQEVEYVRQWIEARHAYLDELY